MAKDEQTEDLHWILAGASTSVYSGLYMYLYM